MELRASRTRAHHRRPLHVRRGKRDSVDSHRCNSSTFLLFTLKVFVVSRSHNSCSQQWAPTVATSCWKWHPGREPNIECPQIFLSQRKARQCVVRNSTNMRWRGCNLAVCVEFGASQCHHLLTRLLMQLTWSVIAGQRRVPVVRIVVVENGPVLGSWAKTCHGVEISKSSFCLDLLLMVAFLLPMCGVLSSELRENRTGNTAE